jgi:hypothetical protein
VPFERSDSADGGPLRYRVRHRVNRWKAGSSRSSRRPSSRGMRTTRSDFARHPHPGALVIRCGSTRRVPHGSGRAATNRKFRVPLPVACETPRGRGDLRRRGLRLLSLEAIPGDGRESHRVRGQSRQLRRPGARCQPRGRGYRTIQLRGMEPRRRNYLQRDRCDCPRCRMAQNDQLDPRALPQQPASRPSPCACVPCDSTRF